MVRTSGAENHSSSRLIKWYLHQKCAARRFKRPHNLAINHLRRFISCTQSLNRMLVASPPEGSTCWGRHLEWRYLQEDSAGRLQIRSVIVCSRQFLSPVFICSCLLFSFLLLLFLLFSAAYRLFPSVLATFIHSLLWWFLPVICSVVWRFHLLPFVVVICIYLLSLYFPVFASYLLLYLSRLWNEWVTR